MIKVLWMSSAILSNDSRNTGSWLHSMANLLVKSSEVYLVNMVVQWGRKRGGIIHKRVCERLEEYILPNYIGRPHGGKPLPLYVERIKKTIVTINPDIVHVWGAEPYFSKIVTGFKLNCPLLLEIQGLREECADVFRGDLTLMGSLKLLRFVDLLTLGMNSFFKKEFDFRRRGVDDRNAIMKFEYIATQSQWVRDMLSFYSHAYIYETKMSIRKEFLEAEPWKYPEKGERAFYFSASGAVPYKCIQTVFKALSLVKLRYPNVRLKVAGNFRSFVKWTDGGYQRYLINLLDKLDIRDSVDFLGNLTADEIVNVEKTCIAVVQTSFIETYSLVNAEALCLGVPLISSFAGAMPELGKDGETVLYYQPGDYRTCASKMIKLLENKNLAETLSQNSVVLNRLKHSDNEVLQCQIKIYKDILRREIAKQQ